MANEWHVPYELLNPEAQDLARAIQSLIEELEAVDWYHQRAQVTHDEMLRRLLEHNRDEEKEHASMILEWIRRRDPTFDGNLRTYLFAPGDILEAEQEQRKRGAGSRESSEKGPAPSDAETAAAAPVPSIAGETPPSEADGEEASGAPLAFTVGPLRKPRSSAS